MEMIINNVPKRLEFGDYGNWGTLVPEAVKIEIFGESHLSAVVTYNYGKNDNRTINLCHSELDEVDWESFGTTFEKELIKLGLKTNEVQKLRNEWHVIKMKDGSVIPYAKYKVAFDRLSSYDGSVLSSDVNECIAQGEERAIEQTKKWERNYTLGNIKVEKIGEI